MAAQVLSRSRLNMLKRQINHFLAQKIPDFPSAELLVAVSGGLDSMVLFHLMDNLAKEEILKFKIVHFNHHLRGRCPLTDS